jgi:hypothetical protein
MNTQRFGIDDRVIIDPTIARPSERDVIYRITRILKVNVVIERVDGAGRPVRINHTYLRPATASDATTATAAGQAMAPYQQPLVAGTVTTIAGPGWKQPPEQLTSCFATTATAGSPASNSAATTADTGVAYAEA